LDFRALSWIAALVLAASASGCSGCSGCGGAKKEDPKAQAEARAKAEASILAAKMAQDRQNAPALGVVEFIQEFTDDPATARAKYEGQMFKVTGTVKELEGARLTIHDRNGAAQCVLPPEQAKILSVGQSATITGLVTPGSGHVAIRLNSCELMTHGTGAPPPAVSK
jgi:hypothetical protein